MTTSHSHNAENDEPIDRVIGEYLEHADRLGKAKIRDARQAILKAYPELQAELNDYFLDEDGADGAMARFVSESDAVIHERVIRYLGSYELLELIGRGGMGEVYRARQITTGRIVAVKLMRMTAPSKRFQREIQIIAKLNHPNIVTLFEAGEDRGEQFYAMEYINGGSLTHRSDVNPRQAAELGLILANTLRYAHEQKILHRDIKPDNILLDDQGRPLLADFGLAKLTQPNADATVTQNVVGTFAYMSPEQARGQNAGLTPASDLYSLGATLYQVLCGHPPIQGPNPAEIIKNIQSQDVVSPRTVNSAVPRDLSLIILKCLHKNPRDRYQSAEELADHFTLFLSGRPVPIKPIPWSTRLVRWVRREPRIAGLMMTVFVVLFLGLLISQYFRSRAVSTANQLTISEREANQRRVEAEMNRRISDHRLYARWLRSAREALLRGEVATGQKLLGQADPRLRHWEYGHVAASHEISEHRLTLPREDICYSLAVSNYELNLPEIGKATMIACGAESGAIYTWFHQGSEFRGPIITSSSFISPAVCVVISSSGTYLASGNKNGNITIHNMRDPQRLFVSSFFKMSGEITAIAVMETDSRENEDEEPGLLVAAASSDATIVIWDLESREEVTRFNGGSGRITSLALAQQEESGETILVSGDRLGAVKIWSLLQAKPTDVIPKAHQGGIMNVRIINSQIIGTCGSEGGIKVWKRDPLDELSETNIRWRQYMTFSTVGMPDIHAGSLASGGTAAIWVGFDSYRRFKGRDDYWQVVRHDPMIGEQHWFPKASSAVIADVTRDQFGVVCAMGGLGLTAAVGCVHEIFICSVIPAIRLSVFSPNQLPLVPGLGLPLAIGTPLEILAPRLNGKSLVIPSTETELISMGYRGDRFATIDNSGVLQIWEIDFDSPDFGATPHQQRPTLSIGLETDSSHSQNLRPDRLTFTRDDRFLIIASEIGQIMIFDAESGSLVNSSRYDAPITAIDSTADGQSIFLAAGSQVWRISAAAEPSELLFQVKQVISDFRLLPSRDQFVIAFAEGAIHVCDFSGKTTLEFEHRLAEATGPTAIAIEVHPTEPRLFSIRGHAESSAQPLPTSQEGSLIVWDLETGEPVWEDPLPPTFQQPRWLRLDVQPSETVLTAIAHPKLINQKTRQLFLQQWKSKN